MNINNQIDNVETIDTSIRYTYDDSKQTAENDNGDYWQKGDEVILVNTDYGDTWVKVEKD